jgi:glycosyltransferase involved in cell wall biosynthesis
MNTQLIKELTVFSNGDSSKTRTWSNVPFFFTKTLIEKGIKVNRVDISQRRIPMKVYGKVLEFIFRILNKKSHYTHSYLFSHIHFADVRKRIKKAIKKYPNSDANIFLTFGFSSTGMTEKPCILFSDWSYDYHFKYFEHRNPDFFERGVMRREDEQIEGSDLIISLFPGIADYMKNRYTNKNICYLGNVINSIYESEEAAIIEKKQKSMALLFVGSGKYIEGAKTLIQAFRNLKEDYRNLSLNIIGMTRDDFDLLPEGVTCHGYLDKGDEAERKRYYSIFESAKVLINTTPKWAAFSSTIEAMYFYTPIIVTPYEEFTTTFGEDIGFGYYCDNDTEHLENAIKQILIDKSYESVCVNAHNSVKKYTWSAYIDKVLEKLSELR